MPLCVLILAALVSLLGATDPTAVPTYHCMSLYWQRSDGSATRICQVEFRQVGSTTWKPAQPLVWDASVGPRYSGSVVNLTSGTSYEFRLSLASATPVVLTAATRSDTLAVARRVVLPAGTIASTYFITEGGSATSGHVLYEAHPSGTVIDVDPNDGSEADAADYGVEIRASWVILRGVTVRDARKHGVFLNRSGGAGLNNVVIEGCTITNWGSRNSLAGQRITVRMRHYPTNTTREETNVLVRTDLGRHLDCAIRANGSQVERITIQGNRILRPRYTSNLWTEAAGSYFGTGNQSLHPEGPKAVVLYDPGVDVPTRGNHVIRWNEITGDANHRFNDALFESFGGSEALRGNDARQDTDIYGNIISDVADDTMETERAVANVRVFGNYFSRVYKGVSFYQDSPGNAGPFYLFRNIFDQVDNPSRPGHPEYSDRYTRLSGRAGYLVAQLLGDNRLYMFHNTFLAPGDAGFQFIFGNDWFATAYTGAVSNQTRLVARNNIFRTSTAWPFTGGAKTTHNATVDPPGTLKPFDGDLHNGTIESAAARGPACVRGEPVFASGHGVGAAGRYQLAMGSPGRDAGVVLANFNDGFDGAAPDAGAHEAGSVDLILGPAGWRANGAPNTAPTVDAGPAVAVVRPAAAALDGTVTDDGLPAGSTLTAAWSKASGPGTVTFANSSAIDTTATFSVDGTYVLRLTVSDSTLSSSDDVQVTVAADVPTDPGTSPTSGPGASDGCGVGGVAVLLTLGMLGCAWRPRDDQAADPEQQP